MFANFSKDDRFLIAKINLCQVIPNSVDQGFDFTLPSELKIFGNKKSKISLLDPKMIKLFNVEEKM